MCVFKAHCLVLDNPNDVFFPVFSGRVLSLAPSFTQLPEVLCIGLRPPGSFSFVLLHVCKSRRIRDFSVRWCLHSNIRSYTHKVSLSFCFFFFLRKDLSRKHRMEQKHYFQLRPRICDPYTSASIVSGLCMYTHFPTLF